jgi:hypothetical protein
MKLGIPSAKFWGTLPSRREVLCFTAQCQICGKKVWSNMLSAAPTRSVGSPPCSGDLSHASQLPHPPFAGFRMLTLFDLYTITLSGLTVSPTMGFSGTIPLCASCWSTQKPKPSITYRAAFFCKLLCTSLSLKFLRDRVGLGSRVPYPPSPHLKKKLFFPPSLRGSVHSLN